MKRSIFIAVFLFIGILILTQWERIIWPIFRSNADDDSLLTVPADAIAFPANQEGEISVSRQNAITRAVEKLSPAIVGINATETKYYSYSPLANDPFWKLFFPDRVYQEKVPSLGSGFVISDEGFVVTNEHVVGDALEKDIVVTTTDGKNHEVEWVRKDELTDIVLLKINGSGFPYARFGNSNDVIIGEWAIALGNPFGLFAIDNQPSVTVGVISATHRDFGLVEERSIYKDMIQTDASINPGNSGGPLANSLGEVIGVNTFIYTGSRYSQGSVGVGFAIPSNKVREIIDELLKYGKIDRSYETGIELRDVNRYVAYALGLNSVRGVYVSKVERGSSGDKAGVKVGDLVLGINGKPIENSRDAKTIIRELDLRTGSSIEFEVMRGGKRLMLKVLLAEPRKLENRQ